MRDDGDDIEPDVPDDADVCELCQGRGWVSDPGDTCPECDGTGLYEA
jgi:DnaJ-class molecular chaperone